MPKNGKAKGRQAAPTRRTAAEIALKGLTSSKALDEYLDAIIQQIHQGEITLAEAHQARNLVNTKVSKAKLRMKLGSVDPILS